MVNKRSPDQRRKNMQAIRSKGSKIERRLAMALWGKGYRYRKNDKTVYGTPDLVFKSKKLAIFVDSEFWHGKDWKNQQERLKTNREFWLKKIEANIRRDILVNITLQEQGWTVLRFWGKEIEKELERCVEEVENALHANSYGMAAEPKSGYRSS